MEWQSQASWIWVEDFDDTVDPGQFVLFRKTFALDSVPEGPCLLKVSADTRYRCFVNGESVSFGPCKSFPAKWYYEEVDISSHLVVGLNVISARVLRFSPSNIGSSSLSATAIPGLIVHCIINDINISTNKTWRSKKDTSITLVPRSQWNYALGPPFLSLSEKVEGSLMQRDWTSIQYQDDSWPYASISTLKSMMLPVLEPWSLNERPIPILPEIETSFHSALKTSTGDTGYWNEFLRGNSSASVPANSTVTVDIQSHVLTTGFLQLFCSGGAGSSIKIVCAESYERDMSTGLPRCKTDRADFETGTLYGPEDTYTTADGDNTYEPFWFRTFRYIRLTISTASNPLVLTSFTYRSTHYPLEQSTIIDFPAVSLANPTIPPSPSGAISAPLSKIWSMSVNTLRNCMHETYEDCPYYEQNQFAMDSRLMLLFTYQLSRDARLPLKTISEFAASQLPSGLLQTNFPTSTRNVVIPTFSLYWILMVEDYHRYFQDRRFVRRYLGIIDRILGYFDELIDDRGLVGQFPGGAEVWPYVDWVSEWMGNPRAPGGLHNMCIPKAYKAYGAATYNSLIYAVALKSAAKLSSLVGRGDTAREYDERAQALNRAVNDECWDGDMYLDGPGCKDSAGVENRAQHSQIFAVLSGAIEGSAAQKLMQHTFALDNLPKASFAMLFYAFRAVSSVGLYDTMFATLMAPWTAMERANLTTCAESDVLQRSDCHGWSAAPIYEVIAEILGVEPAQIGGSRTRVAPRMGLQESFRGKVVLRETTLTVSWDRAKRLTIVATNDVEIDIVVGGISTTVQLKKDAIWAFDHAKSHVSADGNT